jgi:hypothetical protein
MYLYVLVILGLKKDHDKLAFTYKNTVHLYFSRAVGPNCLFYLHVQFRINIIYLFIYNEVIFVLYMVHHVVNLLFI